MKFAAVLIFAVTLTVGVAKPRPRENLRSVRSVDDMCPLGASTEDYEFDPDLDISKSIYKVLRSSFIVCRIFSSAAEVNVCRMEG